jgi:hypothetical protein
MTDTQKQNRLAILRGDFVERTRKMQCSQIGVDCSSLAAGARIGSPGEAR